MDKQQLLQELQLKAVRSSGAGGQNVNKVATKIELYLDILNSTAFSDEEKVRIQLNPNTKLTKEGILILTCDETRSHHKNKELVLKKLVALLKLALKKPKVRKATQPTKAAITKRLDKKQQLSTKKELRKKPDF